MESQNRATQPTSLLDCEEAGRRLVDKMVSDSALEFLEAEPVQDAISKKFYSLDRTCSTTDSRNKRTRQTRRRLQSHALTGPAKATAEANTARQQSGQQHRKTERSGTRSCKSQAFQQRTTRQPKTTTAQNKQTNLQPTTNTNTNTNTNTKGPIESTTKICPHPQDTSNPRGNQQVRKSQGATHCL